MFVLQTALEKKMKKDLVFKECVCYVVSLTFDWKNRSVRMGKFE